MTDEPRDGFEDLEPEDEATPFPRTEESLDIAWGFIVLLVFAALLAIFIVQNTEDVRVEFLFWDITLSVGVIIVVVALVTLTFDQLVSLLYRRRKRKERTRRLEEG
jgi:uncharacterized integral membrane protein